ncbi:MAG TPA: type II toxin-antitoxin system VapC family toxin [Tepidisphaeraceae bacterium]|nr:type II toxin-antitoxin system VapC family toxin [Tepidisphaeraceae bacterium]
MIYVLDTDILTLLAHDNSPEAPRIRRRIAELSDDELVVTTIINYEEQMRGWMAALNRARSPRAEVEIYARLLQYLLSVRRMTVLDYSSAAATIVAQLRRKGVSIGAMDLKIAAIVLSVRAVLITRNARDFRKVPDLSIEDWSIVTSY